MKVRVLRPGYIFGSMQKVDSIIVLENEKQFSEKWMEKIDTKKALEAKSEDLEKIPSASANKKKFGALVSDSVI